MDFISFFHSSPDILLVFDGEAQVIEVNKTASIKLGYSSEELFGQSIYLLYHPDKREQAREYLMEILHAKRSYLPIPLISKSGSIIHVETNIAPGSWRGKPAIFFFSRDISDTVQAEEAAKRLQERYRILFDNINDAAFVHSLTEEGLPGKFVEANRIACERLGYTREEFLEMTPKDIDPPEQYALVPGIMKKLRKEKHIIWEGVHLTKNGQRIPVEISNHLFMLEGKEVILATVKDITERKKVQYLLEKSEEKYRKIFENVQDIFYQADIDGRITEISPSIERYSGYRPDELIGMKADQVYVNRGDREDLMKVILETGEIVDHIIKLKSKTGKEAYVSANIHLLYGKDGKPAGVEGSLRDVSSRIFAEQKLKESEALLRKQNEEYAALNAELRRRNDHILMINKELRQASDIFLNIRTGLFIYHLENSDDDASLRLIGANPAAEKLIGISARDFLGNTIDENFPDLRKRGIPKAFADVILTGKPEQFDEFVYSDNRVIEGAFTFNAFPLPENCVGISFENVTEQFRAKEELIESNRQLIKARDKAEESDRLKSAFLANMSHEIRTPMNGIMGFSMMLADPSLPEESRESYVKIVSASCDQLLHIVNDIIDISKIEAGQVEISESAFDLKILLNEVCSFYTSTALEKGIKLELDQSKLNFRHSSWIISDRTKLRQILDNLMSNAMKFTPAGKITLRCTQKDDFLSFEVEDTGIGIEDELQTVIFERFRQVESTYTKTYGGTGLGLAISKAYAEKMGGEISVSSVFGKGSVFSFRLPYKPAVSDDTLIEEVSRFRPLDLHLKILVVEDEEINWLYLNEILKNRVKILRAVNGKEAVELVKKHQDIDIILMDIKLPDINGLDLTRKIKSMNRRVKVIAQTAYALAGDRDSVIAAGCSGYISKPVNRDELLNLITAYSDK
jgi:PAS domain S-box-containing protein